MELQGDVLILQRNRVPLIFNQLSRLNQTLACLERHSDPQLCSYCIKHGGNHHLGIFCVNSPVVVTRLFHGSCICDKNFWHEDKSKCS